MAALAQCEFNWLEDGVSPDAEVFGPYVVTKHLGAGGTSTVDEAVRHGAYNFKQRVALKRVLANLAAHPEFTGALIREGKLASHLNHPGIAKTFDLGCVNGTYYMAMELVAGIDLRRILARLVERRTSVPVAIAVNLLAQMADALDYAHTIVDASGVPLGITHRDISPANVLIAHDGTAKLIDFGVAKATANMFMTTSGKIKGKFAYMAPEAMAGRVDHRVDLFGLGIIAYEMLTARPLFAGATDVDTIHRVKTWNPPSLAAKGIPLELDAIIQKALAKNPDERWASAADMSAAIEQLRRKRAMATSQAQVATWLASLEDKPPCAEISTGANTSMIARPANLPPINRRRTAAIIIEEMPANEAMSNAADTSSQTIRMDIASLLRAAHFSIKTPVTNIAMPAVVMADAAESIAAKKSQPEPRPLPHDGEHSLPSILLAQPARPAPTLPSIITSAPTQQPAIVVQSLTRTIPQQQAPRPRPSRLPGSAVVLRAQAPSVVQRVAWRMLAIAGGISLGFVLAYLILS